MTTILSIGLPQGDAITSIHDVVEIPVNDPSFTFDCEYSAIVIASNNEVNYQTWLKKIRASKFNFLSLVYTTNTSLDDLSLTDGIIPADIDSEINEYHERKRELNLHTNDNLENKLLTYLWVSRSRRLTPVRIINQGVNYQYPLLELWDKSDGKDLWLNRMVKQGNISQETLVNRIRQCLPCQSSLLNYVDSCVDCGSIDLKIEQAIHCFPCGHIADQKAFIRSGEMVCPKCTTTLRHIGTDYDRPIENQRCNACSSLFIDAKVAAQCFSCGHSNKVDDLVQKEYFSFSLAHNGIIKVKTGAEAKLLATSVGEPVAREHFYWVANWLNKMAIRNSEHHLFVGLRFVNLIELTQSMSTIALTGQLEAFNERICKLLRTTDVFCQYNDDTLFFLLSGVPETQVKAIEAKLLSISNEQKQNPLIIKAALHLLPDHSLSNDVALWFMERSQEMND